MSAARTLAITAVALAAATGPALADDGRPVTGIPLHAEAGVTMAGGGGTVSVAFRGYLGGSLVMPGALGRWRPFVGGGLHLGSGVISVADPRALDGAVDLVYQSVGPELRAGLRFVDGGFVDSQLYLAAAPLQVGVDARLMLDAVEGVAGGDGLRLAVGVAFADQWFAAIEANRSDSNWLMVLMPVIVEVTWERSAGFDRTGVSLGWGF